MNGRAILGVIAFWAALGLATAVPAGAAVQSFNVGADHANCDTVNGVISFGTALHAGGPATSEGANLKGALAGCTDQTNASVKMFHGSYSGSFAGPSNDCATWFGGSLDTPLTGALTLTWNPGSGQDFTPKTTVGASQKRLTTSPLTDWIAQPPSTVGSLPGSYQNVAVTGTPGSGAFGGSTGPSLTTYLATDYGNIFAQCAASKGLKTVQIGVANLAVGGSAS